MVASQIARFAPVQSSQRDTLSATRAAGAAARGRPEFVLALGAEPLEQRDIDIVAPAEVVVHEPVVTPAALAMSSIETWS